jgi:hypothetical protein
MASGTSPEIVDAKRALRESVKRSAKSDVSTATSLHLSWHEYLDKKHELPLFHPTAEQMVEMLTKCPRELREKIKEEAYQDMDIALAFRLSWADYLQARTALKTGREWYALDHSTDIVSLCGIWKEGNSWAEEKISLQEYITQSAYCTSSTYGHDNHRDPL